MDYRPLKWLPFALLLSACGGGGGNGSSDGGQAGDPNRYYVRVAHLIEDGPSIRVSGDGRNWARGTPYSVVTSLLGQDLGSATSDVVQVTVDSQDLDNSILDRLITETIEVDGDTETTLVVGGSYTEPYLLTATAVRRAKPVDRLYFQFAHAAPALGPVDVYVTAPNVDLATTAPFASLAPLESTASVEVAFDETVIRLTTAGTLDVVFESGKLDFDDDPADTEDGFEWFMAIAPNLIAGSSSFKLVGGDGRGDFEIYDKNLPAAVRVIHASPDGPPVDVIIGDDFANPLAEALSYGQRTASGAVPGGRASLNFTAPGDPTMFLYEDTFDSPAGFENTLFLAGEFEDLISPATPAQPRGIFTQAQLRVVNITTDDDFFTVYLPLIEDAGDNDEFIENLPPGATTDYGPLDPATYELRITKQTIEIGDDPNDIPEVPVFGPQAVVLGAGTVTTLVIFPPANPGEPEVVTVYDDLEP